MRLLTCLLLAAPTVARPQDPAATRPDVARIQVANGRTTVSTRDGREVTLRTGDSKLVGGPAHVEVAAGSQVRLSWAGRASLEVFGPAAMQWDLAPESSSSRGSGLSTYSERGLEWHFFDATWIDVEARRGRHLLDLPGDWRLDCESGAWHVRGLAGGPLEVHHHAGSPSPITWIGSASGARPPLTLYPGSSLRLDQLPRFGPLDGEDDRAAWGQHQWPWRGETDTPAQRAQRQDLASEVSRVEGFPTRDPRADGPKASIKGMPEVEDLRIEIGVPARTSEPVAPAPERAPRASVDPAPQPLRVETAPKVAVEPAPRPRPAVPSPLPAPAPARVGYDPEQWRGLSHTKLDVVGQLAVQDESWSEVRVFASGRVKILVDADAPSGIWVFGPSTDHWLEPGAVAMFEASGAVVLRYGRITDHEPVAGRPSYSAIQ